MKNLKGIIAFLVLVVAPLVFWISEKGLTLRQEGMSFLPIILAPVQAAIFAFIVSGLPGKKLVGKDDEGNWFVGRFWGVFAVLTLALLIFAFILKGEA